MKIPAFVLLPLLAFVAYAAPQSQEKRVALVFDDGPIPSATEPLVSILKKENLHGTFSLVGSRVQAHPETARAMVETGEEVIKHSQTHAHPDPLSNAELENEVADAQRAITVAVGQAPRWYWPPFLEKNDRVLDAVRQAQLRAYEPKHLVISKDYDTSVGAEEIFRRATTGVEDGTLILFHEWRKETRTQLPPILAELRRQNCGFMTCSELADSLARPPVFSN